MGAVESLAAWGIVRPAEVVELAATTGLPLALAASLLEQESGGGRNVFGHDRVETGGVYVPGAEVTRAAYERYRDLANTGKIGRQGVGPVQLTARVFQDRADSLGGCWDWRVNCRVGFETLAALVRQYGLADGVRRYNGSGPAAEAYRDKMLARVARWTDRLGGQPHVMPVPPPAQVPPSTREDATAVQVDLRFFDDAWKPDPNGLNFRGALPAEAAASSVVVDRAWVRWVSYWGTSTFRVVAWDDAKPLGEANPALGWWELPAAVRGFTVEGRRSTPGTVPAASLVTLAK